MTMQTAQKEVTQNIILTYHVNLSATKSLTIRHTQPNSQTLTSLAQAIKLN